MQHNNLLCVYEAPYYDYTSFAVDHVAYAARAFFVCGSVKVDVFSFVLGRERPKTKKKMFLLRGGDRERLFSPPAGRKETFVSFVLKALPPKRTKKTVFSMLPQAKKPWMRPASAPTA
jgi:hypothetical protein